MSFLVVVSDSPHEWFEAGLETARELKGQQPTVVHVAAGVRVAAFPRATGTGGGIEIDAASGSWVVRAGTALHDRDLLSIFLQGGADALARSVEGAFVIVAGDGRTGAIFAITDPVGSRHAFVRMASGVVALSASSLVLAGVAPVTPDPIAVQEQIRTATIYEDRTLYREVRRLAPASIHAIADGRITSRRYWNIGDVPRDRLGGARAADALAESLAAVVRRVARSHPKIVCDLTGGYDSRAVLAGCLHAGVDVETTVSGTPGSDDTRIARAIADSVGIPLRYVAQKIPSSMEEMDGALAFTDGEYDLLEYARILSVHRELSRTYDISLNGTAGELGRGKHWGFAGSSVGAIEKLNARRIVSTRLGDASSDPSLFPARERLDLTSHFVAIVERLNDGLAETPNTLQLDSYYLMRMRCWQGRIASSTDHLWSCLSPFLARSVMEVALQIGVRSREHNRVFHEMFARSKAPALARIPVAGGRPPAPLRIGNAHLFAAVPMNWSARAITKAARMAGLSWSLAPTGGIVRSPRLDLWALEDARSLLDPSRMQVASVLDAARLEAFLAESRSPAFGYDGAWSRLLGIEHTFRRLARVAERQRPRLPPPPLRPRPPLEGREALGLESEA